MKKMNKKWIKNEKNERKKMRKNEKKKMNGARRAPRLLVANKVGHILTKTHKRPHSSLARKSPAQRLENPTWQILLG